MLIMETKICRVCGKEKPIEECEKRENLCKKCKKIYNQNYRKNNLERIKKQKKKSYQQNCEKIKEKSRKYYSENIEKMKNTQRKYRDKNREIKIEYNKKYYKENKEKLKEQKKEYYNKNIEKIKITKQKYYEIYKKSHKEHIKKYGKKYYSENRELILKKVRENEAKKQYRKQYYKKNKKDILLKRKKYCEENHEMIMKKRKEYEHKKNKTDPIYKFKRTIRSSIQKSFIRKHKGKSEKTEGILGCNLDFFVDYLINTYENNYNEKWNWDKLSDVAIDHIIPLAVAKTEEEVIKLCHYTNLQLLTKKDNLDKSDKLDWSLKK